MLGFYRIIFTHSRFYSWNLQIHSYLGNIASPARSAQRAPLRHLSEYGIREIVYTAKETRRVCSRQIDLAQGRLKVKVEDRTKRRNNIHSLRWLCWFYTFGQTVSVTTTRYVKLFYCCLLYLETQCLHDRLLLFIFITSNSLGASSNNRRRMTFDCSTLYHSTYISNKEPLAFVFCYGFITHETIFIGVIIKILLFCFPGRPPPYHQEVTGQSGRLEVIKHMAFKFSMRSYRAHGRPRSFTKWDHRPNGKKKQIV